MDSRNPKSTRLQERSSYADPQRECDVVMKGGITSGVLYPKAICELATAFRLRSIGGTSAGAIGAAAAAAAEYGRDAHSPGSGFDGLAVIPDWLAADGNLTGLFRPNRSTSKVHALVMSLSESKGRLLGTVRALLNLSLPTRRWWMPVLGMLPGLLILAALATSGANAALTWAAIVLTVPVCLIGGLGGATAASVLKAGEALERNFFGVVSGSDASDGGVSLSDWLTDKLDQLAGRSLTGSPLTLGDLWGSGGRTDPDINLEMLATNITEGRPYRLPFELTSAFAFSPAEFRQIFPDRVVDHMVAASRRSALPDTGSNDHADGTDGQRNVPSDLMVLPPVSSLPVVVITRMSLSFPLLISAIPLYSIDRSLQNDQPHWEKVWFSDGGITSNFPVSFFDTPLPSRPTFGINLRSFHPSHPKADDQRSNVWMPRSNRGGILQWWTRIEPGHGARTVAGFLASILDTMQNWIDNAQMRVPGYRDRIVHISHDKTEGGMNLAMPPETIDRLAERGRCAGEMLVDYYTNPPEGADDIDEPSQSLDGRSPQPRVVSWENHRWIRLRTSMSLCADLIEQMSNGFNDDYRADLFAPISQAPSYRFANKDQQALAQAFMDAQPFTDETPLVLPASLRQMATALAAASAAGPQSALRHGTPSPMPVLRVSPGSPTPREDVEEDRCAM